MSEIKLRVCMARAVDRASLVGRARVTDRGIGRGLRQIEFSDRQSQDFNRLTRVMTMFRLY